MTSAHRWCRRGILCIGVACMVGTAAAQPNPEEPTWSTAGPAPAEAPESGPPEATPTPTPAAEPAAAAPVPNPDGHFAEAGDVATEDSAEIELGSPDDGGDFLPRFDEGRAFFDREGLKFRVGPVNLRMTLNVGVQYNDNIFGSNTNVVADTIGTITPGVEVGMGDFTGKEDDYLLLTYQPSFAYYQENKEQDRVNQNLDISAQASFSRYSTKLAVGYATNNDASAVQTGGINYGTFDFAWENRYFVSNKVFAQAVLGAAIQNSENDNNSQTFTFSPQVGYQLSPKTTVFAGPYAGIAYVGDGATQTFQGVSVTMEYNTLRKLTFAGTVGAQARQFDGSNTAGATNFITPIFNFAATWKAREKTTLTASFTRDVGISDLQQGLTYTSTAATLGVSQRIWVLGLSLSGSYQIIDYQGDDPIGRTENFFSFNASLGYSFWRNAFNVNVSYQRQERTSDLEFYNYRQNVYSIGLGYRF